MRGVRAANTFARVRHAAKKSTKRRYIIRGIIREILYIYSIREELDLTRRNTKRSTRRTERVSLRTKVKKNIKKKQKYKQKKGESSQLNMIKKISSLASFNTPSTIGERRVRG